MLPSSIVFLFLYSWGTQRFSRERLFNIILGFFVAFYAGGFFGRVEYIAFYAGGFSRRVECGAEQKPR